LVFGTKPNLDYNIPEVGAKSYPCGNLVLISIMRIPQGRWMGVVIVDDLKTRCQFGWGTG